MKSKKEQELLRDILSVLLKYDYVTIEQCMDYLIENKQRLADFLAFANGGGTEIQNIRSKSAIDNVLFTVDKKKSTVIKRIYKYLSGRRFTYEQVYHMSVQYFERTERELALIDLNAENKNELLLALARKLVDLPMKDIHEFEHYIQVQSNAENENTLENWSKVIVKEPSE